jgi:hypothetical protein
MITEENYLKAKILIAKYESEQLNKQTLMGRFNSLDECENEAISFTKNKLKIVNTLLSEDYKIGYKEGIEHYLAFKNEL